MRRSIGVLALLLVVSGGCMGNGPQVESKPCVVKPDEPVEAYCTQQYEPVCGCNERTYGNACMARRDGVQRYRPGRCEDPPPEA